MKTLVSVLVLLGTLLLSGCGQEAPPPQPRELEEPVLETVDRAEQKELVLVQEGQEVRLPAQLYIGEGYSFYLPTEGWVQDVAMIDHHAAVLWSREEAPAVHFCLLNLVDTTPEEAHDWVLAQAPNYAFSQDSAGNISGLDDEDNVVDARLVPSSSSVYVLLTRYPLEAAEGFGAVLTAMAGTFELLP